MSMIFIKKAKAYADLIKLAHTLFALPFAMSAIVLAYINGGKLSWWLLLLILIAFTAARSAAMGFNRIVDVDIDALNPRTKLRPSVTGEISIKDTKLFTIISIAIFIVSAFFINKLCGILSIPALVILLGYSYAKRFTFLAHYILGMALALAPIGAWIAVMGNLDTRIFLLGGCLFFSIAGFDLIYALQDMEFDIKHNLFSIPSRFGKKTTLLVAGISFVISIILLFATANVFELNLYFYAVSSIIALLYFIGFITILKVGMQKVNLIFFYLNASISALILLATLTNINI